MEISDLDLAWLAGFIEGEGWIGITKHRKSNFFDTARVKITTTDEEIVKRIAIFWGRKVHAYENGPERIGTKTYYEVWLCGEAAVRFLVKIRPLLGSRRREQIDNVFNSKLSKPCRNIVKESTDRF